MIDIKLIRTQLDRVRQGLESRGGRYIPALEECLRLDGEWRSVNKELEPLLARRNQAADEVGRLKREKKDASSILKEMEELKSCAKNLEAKAKELDDQLREGLLGIPNIPDPSVPFGKDPSENKVVKVGPLPPRVFPFSPRDHQDLGETLGIFDFERAAKISGARFSLLVGAGARLERALINFMLDLHTQEHGYTEIFPPFLVNRQTMTGTGQLPKFEEELYGCDKGDNLFLIPTAEVPLTNLYRDESLDEGDLPRALCAHTACFRRESGTYGKDTRGLIRNHQFNKIELVRFVPPEKHLEQLELLTRHAETVLEKLDLPYRRVELCTADLGFSSAKTYDLEVWMPGDSQKGGAWREISSCSTFTDYQARRINVRVKRSDGSKTLLHTLNGSGVAVGRVMAALLENDQQEDGTVLLPDVLRPYMGGLIHLTPEKHRGD
jgi:seryl-tRNA synthetase